MAKRLIDATEAKEWAEKHILDAKERYAILDFLRECSTVDAFEVCYCKDCRYARPLNDTEKLMYLDECKVCSNGDATIDGYNIVMPEHFCSYGERKGGQAPQREDV